MIKENQKHFNRLHVVIDALVILVSYLLALAIKFRILSMVQENIGVLPMRIYLGAMILAVPVYLVLYSVFNLYTPNESREEGWNFGIL